MNLDALHEWLIDTGLADDLLAITQATVIPELGNVELHGDTNEKIKELDWARLILAASLLARSQKRAPIEAGLRIATAALLLPTSEVIKDAGSLLLQKLSNYRAVDLAQQRRLLKPKLLSRLGLAARTEALSRSLENSVLVEHSGEWLRVNHFQRRFWTEANKQHAWISVSAPTASGKTFLVLQWLLDELLKRQATVAIYLAPTRALVSEIEDSLLGILRKEKINNIRVSSLPLVDIYKESGKGIKAIFVLTQERMHLLANALNENFKIDLLIADEAHKVGDKLRGIVFQDALERVSRSNPKAKFVFVSPATQNPETLLDDAPSVLDKSAVDSDIPTVLQNVILASQRPRRTTEWELTLRSRYEKMVPIGTLKLPARPTSVKKKLALIAASSGLKGGTLIYTNGAAEAEDVASLISQLVEQKTGEIDSELVAFADLARRGVHESYRLAPLVRKGVAFHYGNMPSLLREEIERLFRIGKIRFLACTSTLIEGVNLSCRTIVVRGPRKGKGQPMEPQDFWNLAGRAGRWGNEFQGNVICVDPDNNIAWPQGVPVRQRYPIRRETDFILDKKASLTDFIKQRWEAETTGLEKVSQFEQVSAYLLTTYLREGSITNASFAKRHDPAFVAKLNAALETLAEKISIPFSLAVRHSAVNPVGLQKLLDQFKNYEGDVEDFLPAPSESSDAYKRLSNIMELINIHIYPAFQPPSLIPLHALIVIEWLKGYSLARIIKERIKYNEKHKRAYDLAKLIRSTMQIVEQTARFTAPKYLSAYMDVLRNHLTEIGKANLISDDIDVGIALEFGVSTRTLLSLMELGLSRMTAVAINEKIAKDNFSRDEVRNWIETHNQEFDGMEIPSAILREVRRKVLGIEQENSA